VSVVVPVQLFVRGLMDVFAERFPAASKASTASL